MSNERKNTADLHPWDSVEGLGQSVSQQHKRAARHMGGYIEQSHLGRNRGSLAADLYRRYHRNSLSFFSGADFPLVNALAHTSLQSDSRGRESLPQFSSLGLDPLHRMVNVSPHRLHIGGKHGLMDIKLRRSAIGLTANQNSSMLIYPSKPSAQSSTVTSNATTLSLMPHSSSMLAHTSEQAIIHRKTGVITEKSSLENSLPAMDTHPSGGHFSYLAQRVVDRQSQMDFILNPAFETPVARFALLEHYNADSKTPPKADAVSGVPAISLKAEPSSEIIAREQQISSAAAHLGNNRSQSSVQRAISRHAGLLCQKHYEPRDNNVFKGEPSRFAGNELWTGNTLYFASPFVSVNRKFTLSSGSRFVGLGLGRKIADCAVGTLSQPGYAADFIPASAITKLALLEHYNADSKTAPRADAVSGVPAISLKAEPSSEIIARQEQILFEATQSGNNHSQNSVQRAINRQNNVLSQQHNESRDNHVFKGGPARFVSNELWTDDHTHYFASPFVTVNRKFSLSSGSRFEGFGLDRKIAGLTEGTLSQPGYAADFIPANTVKKFAPLKYYNADSNTVPRADAVSGVPIISAKAEPSSGIIARQQQILSGAVQAGTNRAQSSVQQAVEKQHSGAVDRSFQPGMLDMRLDLKTALRSIEPGTRHHDSMRKYANIAPVSGENTYFYAVDPLLRGSGISSPIKVKPLVQMLLSRQFKDTVSKKDSDDQLDLTVRRAESGDFSRTRANSFSTDAGNLTSGTVRPAAIEHREFFYREQAIDSAMRLPLAPHSSVQRKVSVSGEHPVAGEIPADLQRQDISNSSLLTSPAASTQKAEAAGAEMGKSNSDSVSSDDIADKVWRKLMRKLASEQERMGGSSRWAS